MIIELKNNHVIAQVSTLGAELIHFELLETQVNYIWSGDSTYWSGQSPVLFPIIGSLNKGTLNVDGVPYTMGNHGFARKSEFECMEQKEHEATFRLVSSPTSLAIYPYEFVLDLVYKLIGNAVSIQYIITNPNDRLMPFQIGTHPAFNCPIGTTDIFSQWFLEFEKKETLSTIKVLDNLLAIDQTTLVMDNTNLLPLTHETFYEGALVFKEVESSHVTLKSNQTNESITLSFVNFPDLAIWQPKDAPFLCIEPWYGHGDLVGFDGDILEKTAMIHLEPMEKFQAELRIRLS